MLDLEPPRHTRLRGLVLRAFTSRRIAALGPEIAALADGLLAGCPAEFDLLERFAQPLPVIVIARLLGVPEAMAPDLARWSHAMVGMYVRHRTRAAEDAAEAAASDFAAFLRDHIAARRTRPADDLITHLIAAEEEGARLSTDEMISTCVLLLNAGHEATVHATGNAVKAILEAGPPPAITPALVEEALRHDPPLHLFTRQVYEDAEVMGHAFAAGSEVALLLGAANRDPRGLARSGAVRPVARGARACGLRRGAALLRRRAARPAGVADGPFAAVPRDARPAAGAAAALRRHLAFPRAGEPAGCALGGREAAPDRIGGDVTAHLPADRPNGLRAAGPWWT